MLLDRFGNMVAVVRSSCRRKPRMRRSPLWRPIRSSEGIFVDYVGRAEQHLPVRREHVPMSKAVRRGVLVFLATIVAPAWAWAVPLPDPLYSAAVAEAIESPGSSTAGTGIVPGTLKQSYSGPLGEAVTLEAGTSSEPRAFANYSLFVPSLPGASASASASSSLEYSFEVAGSLPGTIPVNVSSEGRVSTDIEGGGEIDYAKASMTISGSDSTVPIVDEEIMADVELAHDSAFFALFQNFDFVVNTIYTVDLRAEVSGSISVGPFGGRQFNSAFVDPVFSLDQSFMDEGYRLEFSPGIRNVSAVPLPAALPLFGTCLASAGIFRIKKKLKQVRSGRSR